MKIETKFEIDQEVFYMKDNNVATAYIIGILTETKKNHYYNVETTIKYRASTIGRESSEFNDSQIFESKEELLKTL